MCVETHTATIEMRAFDLGRFEELCAERGWDTTLRIADEIGVHHSTVSRIRRGKGQPGRPFAERALAAFNVEYSVLFPVVEAS